MASSQSAVAATLHNGVSGVGVGLDHNRMLTLSRHSSFIRLTIQLVRRAGHTSRSLCKRWLSVNQLFTLDGEINLKEVSGLD